jgi:hypothetical protein
MDAGPSRPRRSSSSSRSLKRSRSNSTGADEQLTSSDPFGPPAYDETEDIPLKSTRNGKLSMDDVDEELGASLSASARASTDTIRREQRRLATLEQKKALWWRSTAITALFILSW